MISMDKAKALREAGLVWEPKILDRFYFENYKYPGYIWFIKGDEITIKIPTVENGNYVETFERIIDVDGCIFAPDLSQLVVEIYKHEDYALQLTRMDGQAKWQLYCGATASMHYADIPEDAVASALIKILQQRD